MSVILSHSHTHTHKNANQLIVIIPGCPNSPLLLFRLCLFTSAHPSPPSLSLFFLFLPISAPLSSALFAVTFHAVIWAETVCLALAQDLSFHGNFIIVLDAFQAPLDTEALLMSKETCMKWGDVEASIWFCTQPHAKPFNRFSMGVLWYRWIDPTCVAWYFIIFDLSVSQRDNGTQYEPLNCAIFPPPIHVIKSLSQYALLAWVWRPRWIQYVHHDAFLLEKKRQIWIARMKSREGK